MKQHPYLTFLLQSLSAGLAIAFVLVVLKPSLLLPVARLQGSNTDSFSTAVTKAAPTVVNIYSSKLDRQRSNPLLEDPLFRRFFADKVPSPESLQRSSLGSGVIVSNAGYILTNHHVIRGADAIEIALYDGRVAEASVVGVDPESDLAVLWIDLPKLPRIALEDSTKPRVGDIVLAIGNPFGVGQTVTQGIISATGRNRLGINTFENFIQTDAAINPGNSGGALINTRGELLGINTAIFSETGGYQGIGFAIPMSIASNVLKQIIDHGRVIRGWLGLQVRDISVHGALAERLERGGAVLVAGVLPDGPAWKSGMQPGDILASIASQPVYDSRQAIDLISSLTPGIRTQILLLRDGIPLKLIAQIGKRP